MGKIETRRGQALRWVNKIREEAGVSPLEDLIPGTLYAASTCPLTQSIRDAFPEDTHITTYEVMIAYNPGKFPEDHPTFICQETLPPEVVKFVKDFDKGLHPDLIDGTVGFVLSDLEI